MKNVNGAILTNRTINAIKEAQGGLVFSAPHVCDQIIDFLVDADNKPIKKRMELIKGVRLILDFIVSFEREEEV